MFLESSTYFTIMITAATAGLLTVITPCVLPMIPIVVTYFLKRNEKNTYRKYFEPILFSINIIVCFTILGSFFAITFGATFLQNFASNPYWNFTIAIFFVLFAFQLFGFISFSSHGLIQYLQNKYNKIEKMNYVFSNFFFAFIFSITTFTCAVPFIGTLLVFLSVNYKENFLFPIVGMLTFSFVFSIPFLLLSLFPLFLKKTSKSKEWLKTLMVSLGFLELILAFKFFSNADMVVNLQLISRSTLLLIWSSIIFMWGFYFLKVYSFDTEQVSSKKH